MDSKHWTNRTGKVPRVGQAEPDYKEMFFNMHQADSRKLLDMRRKKWLDNHCIQCGGELSGLDVCKVCGLAKFCEKGV